MQKHIIGGAIIERDGKYLLVQEGENHVDNCKGKWGAPGGHVDEGETILEAAVREVYEETGCKVDLTGVCQIGTEADPASIFIVIVFLAKLTESVDSFSSEEISATKWFTYEEICAMSNQLRCPELVIGAIRNIRNGLVAPLDIVEVYPPVYGGKE